MIHRIFELCGIKITADRARNEIIGRSLAPIGQQFIGQVRFGVYSQIMKQHVAVMTRKLASKP